MNNSNMKNILTKSKFKTFLNCPSKLDFQNRGYENSQTEDAFLSSLSEMGIMCGALACDIYAGGYEIETHNTEKALLETNELLKKEDVIIYEACIYSEELQSAIRVDILRKTGNTIELIEVKSKSYSSEDTFTNKKGGIRTEYMEYLEDIAFQYYVASNVFGTEYIVEPYLCMIDKYADNDYEELSQRYTVEKDANGFAKVIVNEEIVVPIDCELLITLDCKNEIKQIFDNNKYKFNRKTYSFYSYVELAIKTLNGEIKPIAQCNRKCKGCEFKEGFKECWGIKLNNDFTTPMIWDLNNLHYRKNDSFIEQGKYQFTDLNGDDLKLLNDRQLAQYNIAMASLESKEIEKDIKLDELKDELSKLKFPLNMIDFETASCPITQHQILRPYEQFLFQFSHHILHKDGTIEHKSEYINTVKGFYPSIKALRLLKIALESNEGDIFRYHNHENTILNSIRKQLLELVRDGKGEEDYLELIQFIEHITQRDELVLNEKGKLKKVKVYGDRNMKDLCEFVKKYYISTIMGGSNSIKYVLPSVLNTSPFLKEKYSKTNYVGLNHKNKAWITYDEKGEVKNPYHILSENNDGKCVNNGGLALSTYNIMQYCNTSDEDVRKYKKELLRYCELDTLSMVFIIEHFLELCGMTDNLNMYEDKKEVCIDSQTLVLIEASTKGFKIDIDKIYEELQEMIIRVVSSSDEHIEMLVMECDEDFVMDYLEKLKE